MRASNELKFGETYVNRESFEAIQGFHAEWRKSGVGGADGVFDYRSLSISFMILSASKSALPSKSFISSSFLLKT
nr:hypothetical protein [Heyndrickxia coagulans]